MACLPGYGEWHLANPKLPWRSNPPFVSLHVNFDNKTGTAEAGTGIGRPADTSLLTNINIVSSTQFTANYTFGSNKGRIEAEIDDHRRLDITFTGTVETSCMGEPMKTTPPGAVADALKRLDRDAQVFKGAIGDAGTQREYSANIQKFSKELLTDVRKGKVTPGDAVRAIDLIRSGIAGGLASRWVAGVRAAAGAAAASAPARWGHLGTATVKQAFGNPNLQDTTWVHFASSKAASSIKESGVTTTVKSSWLRWGEAKTLTHGDLVFQIGPMSTSAEADLGIMAVAPQNAAIKEVKGLYGFKVEGEATAAVTGVEVLESSALKTLAGIERSTGVALADLEEAYAIQKFKEAVKGRPAPAGSRVFDRLTRGEQNQVRLEIIESSMPAEARSPTLSGKWGKIGKCLLIVSVAISIYKIATAEDKLKQASREAVGFAGGLAVGAGFGAVVSDLAPPAAPIIIPLSALIGGILGALGADYVFEWIDQLTLDDDEWWREYNGYK